MLGLGFNVTNHIPIRDKETEKAKKKKQKKNTQNNQGEPIPADWYSKSINPIALRKAKSVYTFGLSECNRV